MLSTPQTETDAVCKRMLFLLVEKFVEVSASAVETGGEGLVLSFGKAQIAILCLPPHLLQEYFIYRIPPNVLFLSTKSINVFV